MYKMTQIKLEHKKHNLKHISPKYKCGIKYIHCESQKDQIYV